MDWFEVHLIGRVWSIDAFVEMFSVCDSVSADCT